VTEITDLRPAPRRGARRRREDSLPSLLEFRGEASRIELAEARALRERDVLLLGDLPEGIGRARRVDRDRVRLPRHARRRLRDHARALADTGAERLARGRRLAGARVA